MTTFAVLVSRDNELFIIIIFVLYNFKCNSILFAKPHPKRHIRPYKITLKALFGTASTALAGNRNSEFRVSFVQ